MCSVMTYLLGFQGQLLTLAEYMLLLYRALLPTPVWYRFFLNKEYGSLFSSLMTGLYLTFKLTSIVEKVKPTFLFPFFLFILNMFIPSVHGPMFWANDCLFSGAILFCCNESSISKGSSLWGLCHTRAGDWAFVSLFFVDRLFGKGCLLGGSIMTSTYYYYCK